MQTDRQPAGFAAAPGYGASSELPQASDRELERGAGAEPVRREVVKLVTSSWHDKRGLHIRRDLLAVRRKSSGYQCLEEDCSMISPDEVWPRS